MTRSRRATRVSRSQQILHTPDGRYLVVRGRLWRATNPDLPLAERERFTNALMQARRDVAAAKREGDDVLLRKARRDVDRAKVALGERGPVWWSDGTPDWNRRLVQNTPYAEWFARVAASEQAILAMLGERDTSFCPSEVARRIDARNWRRWMDDVRTAAWSLARQGVVVMTQRGVVREEASIAKGPIRIRKRS